MSSVDPSQDLTSSSSDKQNALDAIPTSSTDANVTFAKTESAVEDPISSTSSEVCPITLKCAEEEGDNLTAGGGISSDSMGQSKSSEQPKPALVESEEEFLNLNMENVNSEQITEDVEDIVHDLENLLGDTYNKTDRLSKRDEKTNEDVSLALQELEELTKPDEEPLIAASEPQAVNTEAEEEPQNIPLSAPEVSPSVELGEAAKSQSEEPEPAQEVETAEFTNKEPEIIPVVTEPDVPPKQETGSPSVSSICEADEIDSTIQEVASSPSREAQIIKLVRSPVNVCAEETEQKELQIEEIVEEKLPNDETIIVPEEAKTIKEDIVQGQIEHKDEETITVLEEPQSAAETLPPMEIEERQQIVTEPVQPLLNEEEMEVEHTVQNVVREEVEKILPEPILEEEPMVVDDDVRDINEVEMKEATEEEGSILIGDPVVVADIETKELTPQIADVPVELEPPAVDALKEIETVNIAPADENQLITQSSVIDELIGTAAMDSIVTEPTSEMSEGQDVVDSLNVEALPLEAVVSEESVQIALESKAPAIESRQEVIEVNEPVVKCLDPISEKLDVNEKETGNREDIAGGEVTCVPVVGVTPSVVEEQTKLEKENIERLEENDATKMVTEEISNPNDLTVQNQPNAEVVECLEVQQQEERKITQEVTEQTSTLPDIVDQKEAEPPISEKPELPSVTAHEINPSLQTTLTVDVSEQETTPIYDHDEVARLPSPKTAIRQETQHLLKITISKQADNTHSILKVYNPEDSGQPSENSERVPKISIKPLHSPQESLKKSSKLMSPSGVPKVTIKPIMKPDSPVKLTIKPIVKPDEIYEQQQRSSPKLTIKPIIKPDETYEQQRSSPKLTIKPIVKPDDELLQEQQTKTFEVAIQEQDEARSSPKITIKSVVRHEVDDTQKQKFSPKLTIKPIIKPEETIDVEQYQQKCSPKLTIKPIIKPEETVAQEEQKHPKVTIKPIVRPEEQMHSPKITIKPVVKPQEETETHAVRHNLRSTKTEEVDCPKVIIKPVIKPAETTSQVNDTVESEEEIKQERIILKINKNTLPSRKREHGDDGGEKLAKIKVKYSKEGGHAHIVPQTIDSVVKHPQPEPEAELRKRFKLDDINIPQGVTITNVEPGQSRQKEVTSVCLESVVDEVNMEPIERVDTSVFPVAQPVIDLECTDPLGDIPSFENVAELGAAAACNPSPVAAAVVSVPSPRRRGRPRKVPLEVREEFKDPPKEEEEPPPEPVVVESTRPKRSCRGPSVRTTLGIKPRKPRGPGRGRGGKRAMETRATVMKEPRVSIPKLKLLKETITSSTFLEESIEIPEVEQVKEIDNKSDIIDLTPESNDVPIYEEETRMSADAGSSRAQTPAKQVPTPIADVVVEESQSSVQSTATTESVKGRRGPRLEVHQEPEGAIISADQLAEYSWGGGGPYMLQEQVAQFLGIKSFKRKYPGIQRRPVDMQERDFIRESGLASEAMCDLGLTAVNSADILDIMYSDFQPKYEEYCKHQRDRQAKDLTNKQKALTLAASQEKNNLTEQAVQSAAAWNSSFNKVRREKRKACMDLQTFTIHYPKGKVKQINKPPVGNYPVALVPGQFTDYYKEFTPMELSNLPLNTLCYNAINVARQEDDSQSDGSASDSDSSSSDSDSSDSGSSEGENCTMCSSRTPQKQIAAIH